MKITESLSRPGRTAGQGSLAFAVVETVDSFLADLTERQYGALLLLLTLLFGYVQVLIEDKTGKALLRTIPAPNQAELVSDADDTAIRAARDQLDSYRPRHGGPDDVI